jgi:hypothetical protein
MASKIDQLTKDGYDTQFGVNTLGPFHFTTLLLPSLLAVPEPRVINITSDGHANTPRGGIDWKRLKGPKKGSWIPLLSTVEPFLFYGQSKLVCPSSYPWAPHSRYCPLSISFVGKYPVHQGVGEEICREWSCFNLCPPWIHPVRLG